MNERAVISGYTYQVVQLLDDRSVETLPDPMYNSTVIFVSTAYSEYSRISLVPQCSSTT